MTIPFHEDAFAIWRAAQAIYASAKNGDGYQLQAMAALRAASGMEAPSGGETPKSGSTEGDSPTSEAGDAQTSPKGNHP